MAFGTSCAELKKSGIFKSGHYAIKPEGAYHQRIVFCDMSSGTYDDVTESDVSDELNMSPIGTILPWVPKVDVSSNDLLPIPEGWQLCDGSNITVGPWAGGKTPDLNGLFLRGGKEDNVLQMEDSQLQDHKHVDGGHSHNCSASSTAAPHSHTYVATEKYHVDGYTSGGSWNANDYQATYNTSQATVSVSTTCSLGSDVSSSIGGVDSSGANAGSETRPANMKVQYIIRVF